jgi:hypothetical protein
MTFDERPLQASLANKDTQFKETHRKMICGRELFHVRTPHRISADVNNFTSAHPEFADINTAISLDLRNLIQRKKWIADLNTSKKNDLRTSIQRKNGFADFNTTIFGDSRTSIQRKFYVFLTSSTPDFCRPVQGLHGREYMVAMLVSICNTTFAVTVDAKGLPVFLFPGPLKGCKGHKTHRFENRGTNQLRKTGKQEVVLCQPLPQTLYTHVSLVFPGPL